MSSYVYLLRCDDEFKIGKSNSVSSRLASLQTGNSRVIQLVWKVKLPTEECAFKLEKDLHSRFSKYRIKGEWFKVPINILVEEFPGIVIHSWIEVKTAICNKRTVNAAILAEKRQIIKEINISAAYLYDYYISMCQIPVWDLTDDTLVAKMSGMTKRQVGDNRRLLTEKGWIRLHTYMADGKKHGEWYIGKDVVAEKFSQETSTKRFNELGIITDEEYEIIGDDIC